MRTRNKLEALLSQSELSAADAAQALGISVKRVYQVASEPNKPKLKFLRQPLPPRPPTPQIITGGVAVAINATTAGRVSEMLVVADLLARGWQVYIPISHNAAFDIIAHRNGRLITVEVRSARRLNANSTHLPTKVDCQADCYAFVITGEPVIYKFRKDSPQSA